MECKGIFIYKGIEKTDGGEFTDDKGQVIKYFPMYKVKVDEKNGDTVEERIFKFSLDNNYLASKFKEFSLYDKIQIDFKIELYKKNIKLVPEDVNLFNLGE